ncbi:hypothetical protein AVEN_257224-1 [Araneus ventricosus]|uniref:Uncharacterized protein n=1 Tax=Araneus ventricosus TaxID=182803 RepID=A0A4Y2UH96_ARAVE|nr:hypothetical protein AVEN_256809-1 [Araneus ventricosus]GBO12459.1 hypothetical protein AVEN_257224-1 [Araneus ventricosus]
MALEFARRGAPICPEMGHGLPGRGARPALQGHYEEAPVGNMDRLALGRPPSQSLNYGSAGDDIRSPTGSTGTPCPLSQQPSSQQSTDNNSEGGFYKEFLRFTKRSMLYP